MTLEESQRFNYVIVLRWLSPDADSSHRVSAEPQSRAASLNLQNKGSGEAVESSHSNNHCRETHEPPVPTRVGEKEGENKWTRCCQQAAPGNTSHSVPVKIIEVRTKDCLLMGEEFIRNQEQMKPLEEKQEEERSKVDDLRVTPMSVGTLEDITDDNHAMVSTSVGSEHHVSILSFVDKDLLEPGSSILLSHKVHAVVGVLTDDMDPLVLVMKVEKVPQETYAIGGLDNQIQEIKESVELPLTHPEYYEEMGINLPKGVILYGPPDTALIRPGPTDRKIELPLPDEKTKKCIFQIHTSRLTLANDVTLDDLIMATDDLSGADIKGYQVPGHRGSQTRDVRKHSSGPEPVVDIVSVVREASRKTVRTTWRAIAQDTSTAL
ncbi:hypothetical protein GH733_006107 [Mirounga leonina]|nr:hypothetical protein GH733_006107 [Mirounga leonina]